MAARAIGERPDRSCPQGICNGSGWVLGDDDVARPCGCRAERIRRAYTSGIGSGIPKRFRRLIQEASFDRNPVRELDPYVVEDTRRFARRIEENVGAGRGRWFYGDTGTGKTLLAMLISKAALDAGLSVAIYSVPHLLAEIQETYEDDSARSYMGLFRRLSSVDLLHLDDLGTERRTDWVLEQLYSIVNERWQEERSVVVTTNLGHVQLREQVGERTVSRLFGICGDPLPVMGPDLRISSAPELEASARIDALRGEG
jgi:DNA replication protein DnaC